MKGYELPVTCPRCGGDLDHVTGSVLIGTETSAIATCGPCGREYHVIVHLRHIVKDASRHRAIQRAKAAT